MNLPAWLPCKPNTAALPALAFVVLRFVNPAMTGIIAIWSMGLTLYLPWPLYALGLWLTGVTVIQAMRQGNAAGWAILLLMAGGYAPQLSVHAFLSLLAQWMLASPLSPPARLRKSRAQRSDENGVVWRGTSEVSEA